MEQATFPFRDICANRHKGNSQSVAANRRIAPRKASDRERVRIFIHGCGHQGTTLKAIARAFGKFPHQLSGRISELKMAGEIFDSGRQDEDCAILVGRREWMNGSAQ